MMFYCAIFQFGFRICKYNFHDEADLVLLSSNKYISIVAHKEAAQRLRMSAHRVILE